MLFGVKQCPFKQINVKKTIQNVLTAKENIKNLIWNAEENADVIEVAV